MFAVAGELWCYHPPASTQGGIHEGGPMQYALHHRQATLTPVAACCMAVLVAACLLIGMGAVLISSSGVSSSWNPLPLNPLTATRP